MTDPNPPAPPPVSDPQTTPEPPKPELALLKCPAKEYRHIRWLLDGRVNDSSRPVLEKVLYQNGRLFTANGFTVRSIVCPDSWKESIEAREPDSNGRRSFRVHSFYKPNDWSVTVVAEWKPAGDFPPLHKLNAFHIPADNQIAAIALTPSFFRSLMSNRSDRPLAWIRLYRNEEKDGRWATFALITFSDEVRDTSEADIAMTMLGHIVEEGREQFPALHGLEALKPVTPPKPAEPKPESTP